MSRRYFIEHETWTCPPGQRLGCWGRTETGEVPDQANYSPAQGVPLLWRHRGGLQVPKGIGGTPFPP